MKTIKSTFLLVLAFLVLALLSTYSFSATTPFENFQSHVEKAKLGDSEAQYELGKLYFNGRGVEKSYTEAFKWYKKAAEKGLPESQYYLGKLYVTGRGVRQSYTEAIKLFFTKA